MQVKILPISDKFNDYVNEVKNKLLDNDIRVEEDLRAEKIGYKIREARNERVPYIVIVGEKEVENQNIALRSRKNGDEGSVELDGFIDRIRNEIKSYDMG